MALLKNLKNFSAQNVILVFVNKFQYLLTKFRRTKHYISICQQILGRYQCYWSVEKPQIYHIHDMIYLGPNISYHAL